MSKLTEAIGKTRRHVKFDHEIKIQSQIGIMNVLNTSFHGDRPMFQMFCQCKSNKRKLWAGYESAQMDGQTDSYIPP